MKFSIITPTHLKNHFLEELYQSIKNQIYNNWEWVICINNSNGQQLPDFLKNDSRVKYYYDEGDNDNIGRLKKESSYKSNGDVIVEVDHDDLLTEDCLSELYRVFKDDNCDFAYSNNIYLSDDFIPYNPRYGWTYYTTTYNGQERYVMNCFEPSSRSFSFIWYCPNHVRAWKRDFYNKIGGHNETMEVCDDHDLMIRTYLNGKITQIKKPLYVYRIYGNNTWLQKNKLIQNKTVELFYNNAFKLAEREAQLKGLQVIHLEEFKLDQKIPLEDNSVGVIYGDQILKDYKKSYYNMGEIYRILCDNGWAFLRVPSTDGRGAFQDPFTQSFWNENSFFYYTQQMYAQFLNNDTIKFQSWRLDSESWKHSIIMTNAWLTAIKSNERRPHLVEI